VLLLAAGCATNINTVSRAQPEGTPNYVSDKRVITDTTLAATVRIVSVNESVVSGNIRKVQVALENAKDNNRTISYRFEWTDRDGMASATSTAWRPITLGGRETVNVSSVAPSPNAVDFTLKLSEGGH
jgi:uncharacterized protein YcfL